VAILLLLVVVVMVVLILSAMFWRKKFKKEFATNNHLAAGLNTEDGWVWSGENNDYV